MPKTLEDWKDAYYEQQALHTEATGMLAAERDQARHLADAGAEIVARLERENAALREAADILLRALQENGPDVVSGAASALAGVLNRHTPPSDGGGWIPLTDSRKPAEGERVWIAGYGFKGRFYAEAEYQRGEWLMFDQEVDEHIHPCEYPRYWRPIEPIPEVPTNGGEIRSGDTGCPCDAELCPCPVGMVCPKVSARRGCPT